MKRTLALFVALILCTSFSVVFAVSCETTTAESLVKLTSAEAAAFSVTVPSALPMALKSSGAVEVASNVKIVNNSVAPVVISRIEVVGLNGWSVRDYAAGLSGMTRGSRTMSMSINGVGVADGTIDTNNENFPPISAVTGENELAVTYTGKIAPQATAIKTAVGIAEVLFTIGWDQANP